MSRMNSERVLGIPRPTSFIMMSIKSGIFAGGRCHRLSDVRSIQALKNHVALPVRETFPHVRTSPSDCSNQTTAILVVEPAVPRNCFTEKFMRPEIQMWFPLVEFRVERNSDDHHCSRIFAKTPVCVSQRAVAVARLYAGAYVRGGRRSLVRCGEAVPSRLPSLLTTRTRGSRDG
nr:hypothetical protein Iba_chr12cCG20360 [Ipomoea batatas]